MIILSNPQPAVNEGPGRFTYEFAFHGPAQMNRFIQHHALTSYSVRTIEVEPLEE